MSHSPHSRGRKTAKSRLHRRSHTTGHSPLNQYTAPFVLSELDEMYKSRNSPNTSPLILPASSEHYDALTVSDRRNSPRERPQGGKYSKRNRNKSRRKSRRRY